MATVTGLISLINVVLSRDVPFCQMQQLQCLYHGSTKAYLCVPCVPFSTTDNFCYTGYDFNARFGQCRASEGNYLLAMLPKVFKVAGSKA